MRKEFKTETRNFLTRALCTIICLTMVLSLIPVTTAQAFDEEVYGQSNEVGSRFKATQTDSYESNHGSFIYEITKEAYDGNGEVWICGNYDYKNVQSEIVIPPYITYMGNTYTVTKIGNHVLNEYTSSLYIPSTIKEISCLFSSLVSNMKSIVIDQTNPYYMVEDGMIYSKNGKELVSSITRYDTEYRIKDGVEKINDSAFMNFVSLDKIVVPSSVRYLGFYSLPRKLIKFESNTPNIIMSDESFDPEVTILVPSEKSVKDYKKSNVFKPYNVVSTIPHLKNNKYILEKMIKVKKIKNYSTAMPMSITKAQWEFLKKETKLIIKDCKTDEQKAWAIYDWIVTNIAFNKDYYSNSNDYLLRVNTKKHRQSIDNAYAVYTSKLATRLGLNSITNAMMKAAGLKSLTIIEEEYINVMYQTGRNVVYYNGKWHIMDPVRGCTKIRKKGKIEFLDSDRKYDYFDMNLEALSTTTSLSGFTNFQ